MNRSRTFNASLDCPYQFDDSCDSKVRDPIGLECINIVHKLLGYCYETENIRKYVEMQLKKQKLPVDIKREYLSLDDIIGLLQPRVATRRMTSLIKYCIHISTADYFANSMLGSLPVQEGVDHFDDGTCMYIGTTLQGQSFLDPFMQERNDLLVLFLPSEIEDLLFTELEENVEEWSSLSYGDRCGVVFRQFSSLYYLQTVSGIESM